MASPLSPWRREAIWALCCVSGVLAIWQVVLRPHVAASAAPVLLGRGNPAAFDRTPIALMHGMSESYNSAGLASLLASLRIRYPHKYVVSLSVSDGLASILRSMDAQLDEFVHVVNSDANLAGGFDVIGFSQGGLLVRAYVERHNSPPVRRFVSVCAPQEGVSVCPLSPIFQWLCPMWRSGELCLNQEESCLCSIGRRASLSL